ncbi:hypothetical protein [Streptomyces sp. CAU 1734]|uniref:hypothetical protein n=1 Tax=Streptomyces sp. CAU 1734 TaxID=3140360 RepID=UPI00325FE647
MSSTVPVTFTCACGLTAEHYCRKPPPADIAREALLAAVARVRALHQPTRGLGYDSDEDDGTYGVVYKACTTCGHSSEYAVRWPCDTIRALDQITEKR